MQESEEPERNLVADADLHVVVDDIRTRHVLDLVEVLAPAAAVAADSPERASTRTGRGISSSSGAATSSSA